MILFLKPHSSFERAAVLFAFLLKLVFCPASNCLKSNFFQLIPHLLFVNTAFLNVPKISFFWPQDVSNAQYVKYMLHIFHILPLVSTFRNKCELAAYMLNCKINSTNVGTFSKSADKNIFICFLFQGASVMSK